MTKSIVNEIQAQWVVALVCRMCIAEGLWRLQGFHTNDEPLFRNLQKRFKYNARGFLVCRMWSAEVFEGVEVLAFPGFRRLKF